MRSRENIAGSLPQNPCTLPTRNTSLRWLTPGGLLAYKTTVEQLQSSGHRLLSKSHSCYNQPNISFSIFHITLIHLQTCPASSSPTRPPPRSPCSSPSTRTPAAATAGTPSLRARTTRGRGMDGSSSRSRTATTRTALVFMSTPTRRSSSTA